MHRRNFLKLLGITGGVAAASGTGIHKASAASAASVKRNPDAVGVLHDSTLCIGCRRCEEACAVVNNRPGPEKPYDNRAVLDTKRRPSVDSYTVVNKYPGQGARPVFRKTQCNHCQEPACASACFVKAFTKTPEGPVVYDPSLCVGCRYCMIACPFTIPSYDYDKVLNPLVHKCTLCAPRLAEGKQPGCVEVCPTGALLFGKREELLDIARKRIADAPGKYVKHIYGEKEVGGTNWLYLSPVPHEELGQPVLDATSVPELTSGALGSVPMIAGLWPVLLTGAWAITRRKEKVSEEERESAVSAALAKASAANAEELRKALEKAAKDKENALAKAEKDKEAAVAAALAEAKAACEAAADNAGGTDAAGQEQAADAANAGTKDGGES
ncbi:4Fe-4S dicluster domain-containing protein [Desulfovibrio sp. OttesenSCG-928-I05]|nr:4Fe-4S dicluster domain-containing protein [Desulfovibrio sp. OttesenSCG-928-I05]